MQFNGSGHPEWGCKGGAIQRSIGDKLEATPLHFKCLTLDAPSCLPSLDVRVSTQTLDSSKHFLNG